MKQNENTIAPIDPKRSMQIKFHDHSWLFHLSLKKKMADVEKLFWRLGTRV